MPEKKQIPVYDFKKQEKNWSEIWEADKLYQPDLDKAKKPFHNLMMFPYPSAEGLHIGGVYTFTGVDTFGRFKKMQGYDVFEPIGLDGFGIHSENFAMKIGEHIKEVSKRTEKNFYRQLSSIGNMYDWSRTVETYKPEYYKWTQWLFLQLFNKGLAYQKQAKVNWCPWCKTVLSDEQVIQGACERCESQVEKKELKQWFFKITDYADRLLKNLEWIDWSEDVKTNQRNWIGKSEGARVKFQVSKNSVNTVKIKNVKDFREKLDINSTLRIKGKDFKIEQIVKFRMDNGDFYMKLFLENGYVLADDLEEDIFIFVKEIDVDIEKEVLFEGKKYEFSYKAATEAEEVIGKEIFAKGAKEVYCDYTHGNDYLSLGLVESTGERMDLAGEVLKGKDIEINSGEKEDILILHGWEDSSQAGWIPRTKKHLEKLGHRVFAYDAPNPKEPVFEEWLEFIEDKIKESKLKNFTIIGHSMGGGLAVKLAEKHKLKKLVLVAPVGFKASDNYFSQFEETISSGSMEIFRKFQNRNLDIKKAKSNINSFQIIFGEKDPWITEEIRVFYQKNFPEASVQVLKEAGHMSRDEGVVECKELENIFESGLEVFTTRPDTLFGATYMVLAPEHDLIEESKDQIENWDEVKRYIDKAKVKSEQERKEEEKEKTGVEVKGIKAINPVNNEEIPIWVADYVLAGYGTGAIMAVPAHDERDWEFAKKFNIGIRQVVASRKILTGDGAPRNEKDIVCFDGVTAIIKHWEKDEYFAVEFKTKRKGFVGGRVEKGESHEEAVKREIVEESGYEDMEIEEVLLEEAFSRGYKSWKSQEELCRERIFVLKLKSDKRRNVEDKNIFGGHWMSSKEILSDNFSSHHQYYLEVYLSKNRAFGDNGISVNSEFLDGLNTEEAKKKIIKWLEEKDLGEKSIDYKLRDWCVSRQRYWGPPIPIIHCEKCGAVPVPEKDLPVELPDMEDFLPEGKGRGPLAKNEEFVNVKCPTCGEDAKRETDVSDPFVDSAWYFLRYPSTEFDNEAINKERAKKWLPVDSYIGGKEHTVLHLLYSRFITMVLNDLGHIDFEEPYKRFFGHGLITKDGAKMSKSKGNVINPDEMIEKYGTDTVRLYLRFLGDFSQGGDWRDDGAEGMSRFVKKTWATFFDLEGSGEGIKETWMIDKTIKVIGEDLEKLSFNTAVARYMEFVNWIRDNQSDFDKDQALRVKEVMALTLAPMAPFMAEEFWTALENKDSIFIQKWPEFDENNIQDDRFDLVVQINGKVRDKIKASRGIEEEEAKNQALASKNVSRHLDGKELKKIIYIKEKLINIVI